VRQYALKITTVGDGTYHLFGTVGTPGHASALQMRDGWEAARDANPNNYFTLIDPDGRMNLRAGDIAKVEVIVGAEPGSVR
jgi:hypothetical protein